MEEGLEVDLCLHYRRCFVGSTLLYFDLLKPLQAVEEAVVLCSFADHLLLLWLCSALGSS